MTATVQTKEKWEFGSAEWCRFAGELGARLLEESDLDLGKFELRGRRIAQHGDQFRAMLLFGPPNRGLRGIRLVDLGWRGRLCGRFRAGRNGLSGDWRLFRDGLEWFDGGELAFRD